MTTPKKAQALREEIDAILHADGSAGDPEMPEFWELVPKKLLALIEKRERAAVEEACLWLAEEGDKRFFKSLAYRGGWQLATHALAAKHFVLPAKLFPSHP